MYKGHKEGCSVVLEAVSDQDIWIWHTFFGIAGSHNDINILQCSNVFSQLVEGHAPPVNFVINDHEYNKGYYLADGIYPRWATFVKTIVGAVLGGKKSWFAKCQEACRKDVERAFGVLQARFAIVWFPALTWSKTHMWAQVYDPEPYHRQGPLANVDHQVPTAFAAFLAMRQEIRDANTHSQL
jgi:hypothetical protein